MARKRPNWNQQLVACADKGRQAFLDGLPKTACPYGDPKQPYKGGNVTRQRRSYWLQGWEAAAARDEVERAVKAAISQSQVKE